MKNWCLGMTVAVLAMLSMVAAGAQRNTQGESMMAAAQQKENLEGDLPAAIKQYKDIATRFASNHAVAATALLRLAECYQKLGDAESRKIYQEVISKYGDQKAAVEQARARLGGTARQTTEEIFIGKTLTPGASPYGGPYGGSGTAGFHRASPDGRYLAGPSTRGLLLHEVSSNTDRQLTTDGSSSQPCFTPDSRRIVYASSKDGRQEIRIINVDGTGERTILSSDEYGQLEPSGITSDGKTVSLGLFRKDNTWQVGMLSIETGKLTILKDTQWRDTYVGNFSPDGRWLVYHAQVSKDDPGNAAVYTVATDGSAHFTLTSGTRANDFPFFTPDGSRVVFTVWREGRKDLWSVRVADGRPVGEPALAKSDISDVMGFARDGSFYYKKFTLRAGIYVAEADPSTLKLKSAPNLASNPFRQNEASSPAWSPDGKVLAYIADDKTVLHRFDGTPDREIDDARDPAWSPDGKVLAYRSANYRADNKIGLHYLDGTPDREMSFPSSFEVLQGWSPDGKSLVGWSNSSAGRRLLLFDLETQSVRTILEVPQGLTFVFAPDGKAVFYNTRDSATDTARLFRHDLQTGEKRELYHTEAWKGLIMGLKLSPDGRSLTFTKYELPDGKQSSWLLPVSGGEPRKLPDGDVLRWTQDSKALLFRRERESLEEIWVQPVDGSQAYDTGLHGNGISVSLHPDGNRIAFRKLTERVGQVWAIRNLFSEPSAAK
jgi:Tol biopolymer transport system component